MDGINPYILIIGASIVVVISYFFNSISKKTNIPSVLLLILLGIIIQHGYRFMGFIEIDLMPILEILGIVGLIMIVLEAALDLELKKEKWKIIWRSLSIALLTLGLCSIFTAFIIKMFNNVDFFNAMIYAVPLSIMSSAIVIPSVANLDKERKEFMIYESTFSDILGIMLFFFLLGSLEKDSAQAISLSIGLTILITIIVSIVVSYGIIFIFQNLKSEVKLFLLIAVLLLLYAIGKMLNLSSLLIILVFGMVLHNHKLFFSGPFKRFMKEKEIIDIFANFKLITIESSFLIRTFFFVIFGLTITISSLLNIEVLAISLLIIITLYAVRLGVIKLFFLKSNIFPQALIAPRGLITILLFFHIPEELSIAEFDSGILLVTIIVTSIIMAISLIRHGNKKKLALAESEEEQNTDSEHKPDTREVS